MGRMILQIISPEIKMLINERISREDEFRS